jgi:hypothetical protein
MLKPVRASAPVRIRILDSTRMSNAQLRLAARIEIFDAMIRVYDQAGNVIETHEHTGEFKEP